MRLRRSGGRTLLGVKSLAGEVHRGLHRREELEAPATDTLDPLAWPASAARSLVLALIAEAPLVELFTLRQRRHGRVLAGDSSTIELSVDDAEVVAGRRVAGRLRLLEAELRDGPESELLALAEQLGSLPGLRPELRSKYEVALAMVRPRRGRRSRRNACA